MCSKTKKAKKIFLQCHANADANADADVEMPTLRFPNSQKEQIVQI